MEKSFVSRFEPILMHSRRRKKLNYIKCQKKKNLSDTQNSPIKKRFIYCVLEDVAFEFNFINHL